MKKLLLVVLLLATVCSGAMAHSHKGRKHNDGPPKPMPWTISFQYGHLLAFGDDSWDIFKDYKDAHGEAWSVSVGREFTPLISARIKGRYMKLYNRINLEVYEAYKDIYPVFLPRSGFYGYEGIAGQAEVMFNVANLFHRNSKWFNAYLILGGGFNTMFAYDDNVSNWEGAYEGLEYPIDTRTKTMPAGILGGALDFRIFPELSINLEALSTFTGDNMEGVVYEEPYDVYVTISLGVTLHF